MTDMFYNQWRKNAAARAAQAKEGRVSDTQAPTLEMLRARRADILKLTERYGVSNVRVFGSVARGEATPDSDVDFLATFPEGASIFDLVGLWQDLQDLLERDVSLIADETPDERFMRNVLEDAVAL